MPVRKGAALILAHGNPSGIGALQRYFEAAGLDLFVHVDAKVDLEPFQKETDPDLSVTFLKQRTKVFWRGFSMIEATIRLLEAAHRELDRKYFLLLSDDSLPLVAPNTLVEWLEAGREFFQAGATERPQFRQRYDGFYMLDSEATQVRWLATEEREVTSDAADRIGRLDALRSKGKKPIDELHHGSQWWALQRRSVDAILESWSTDHWLRESFEFSEVPDEHYFPTLLALAGRKPRWEAFVHTEWNVPSPPRVFRHPSELDGLQLVDVPFVRKVAFEKQDLADHITSLLAAIPSGKPVNQSPEESPMVHVIDDRRPDLGGNMRHGDVHTFCPKLWRFMIERFGVRSVLDVGCGEGHAVLFFHRLGLFAHGIDGLDINVRRSVVPIARHDLLSGPYVMPVDLVWSCEVAEHIDEASVGHYLETLTNGRIAAITHAVPGQGGYHHVNCQPAEYWIERMKDRGFSLSEDTHLMREISETDLTWNYFSKTGLIFCRD